MDDVSTDAYCVAYLVPPDHADAAREAEEDEAATREAYQRLRASQTIAKAMRAKRAGGWQKVRAAQRAASASSAWTARLNTWRGALNALLRMRLVVAAQRAAATIHSFVSGQSSTLRALKIAMSGGPVGATGQYGGIRSRVCKASLNPTWKTYLELRLEGGVLDATTGEYDNAHAPYTCLRIEVWDRDVFTSDDFIGEVFVRLCPLMDGRVHTYTLPLTDPERKTKAEGGMKGKIHFTLQYES